MGASQGAVCAPVVSLLLVMLTGQHLWGSVTMSSQRALVRSFVLPEEGASTTRGLVKGSSDFLFTAFFILNVRLKMSLAKAVALVLHLASQKLKIGT